MSALFVAELSTGTISEYASNIWVLLVVILIFASIGYGTSSDDKLKEVINAKKLTKRYLIGNDQ